MKIFKMLH